MSESGGNCTGRQAGSGQAEGAKPGKTRKQELSRDKSKGEMLVGSTNKTNREHMYKYTGVNGEDGRHLEGVERSTKTGEKDQGVTV